MSRHLGSVPGKYIEVTQLWRGTFWPRAAFWQEYWSNRHWILHIFPVLHIGKLFYAQLTSLGQVQRKLLSVSVILCDSLQGLRHIKVKHKDKILMYLVKCKIQSKFTIYVYTGLLLLLLSVGLSVANAPDVLQPCGLLYYPWCSNSHHQSTPQEILAVRGGAKPYYF